MLVGRRYRGAKRELNVLTEKQVDLCLELINNSKKNNAIITEVCDYIDRKYSVKTITVFIKNTKKRKEVSVVVLTQKDFNVFVKSSYDIDKNKQEDIKQMFIKFYNTKRLVNKIDDVWISFDSFEDQIKSKAVVEELDKLNKNEKELFEEFNIWYMSTLTHIITVFFYSIEQCENAMKNGLNEKIKEILKERIEANQYFKYFKESKIQIYFDSKEVVDTKYNGNLFYYYK